MHGWGWGGHCKDVHHALRRWREEGAASCMRWHGGIATPHLPAQPPTPAHAGAPHHTPTAHPSRGRALAQCHPPTARRGNFGATAGAGAAWCARSARPGSVCGGGGGSRDGRRGSRAGCGRTSCRCVRPLDVCDLAPSHPPTPPTHSTHTTPPAPPHPHLQLRLPLFHEQLAVGEHEVTLEVRGGVSAKRRPLLVVNNRQGLVKDLQPSRAHGHGQVGVWQAGQGRGGEWVWECEGRGGGRGLRRAQRAARANHPCRPTHPRSSHAQNESQSRRPGWVGGWWVWGGEVRVRGHQVCVGGGGQGEGGVPCAGARVAQHTHLEKGLALEDDARRRHIVHRAQVVVPVGQRLGAARRVGCAGEAAAACAWAQQPRARSPSPFPHPPTHPQAKQPAAHTTRPRPLPPHRSPPRPSRHTMPPASVTRFFSPTNRGPTIPALGRRSKVIIRAASQPLTTNLRTPRGQGGARGVGAGGGARRRGAGARSHPGDACTHTCARTNPTSTHTRPPRDLLTCRC